MQNTILTNRDKRPTLHTCKYHLTLTTTYTFYQLFCDRSDLLLRILPDMHTYPSLFNRLSIISTYCLQIKRTQEHCVNYRELFDFIRQSYRHMLGQQTPPLTLDNQTQRRIQTTKFKRLTPLLCHYTVFENGFLTQHVV